MAAFTKLLFASGFDRVSVQDVAAESRHARSTFYEHFSDKEDVLRACMSPFFAVIAACVADDRQPPELVRVLDHLFENRRLTDAIFSGVPRTILARALTDMVERHLHEMTSEALQFPSRLAAIGIAEGQLALVENWMRGRAFARSEDVAGALHRSSRAAALAFLS